MKTAKLCRKGQVVIPKVFRSRHHWEPGLELMVIDTGDGLLVKPKAPFAPSNLAEVSGMFKGKVNPKTDQQIKAALAEGVCRSL